MPRTCSVCRAEFVPFLSLQRVCSPRCAAKVPLLARAADRELTKKRRDALRPLGYWANRAQTAFNAWIRLRDAGKPCISCVNNNAVQWQAGHYLTVGARPELRFDEANCHRQCSQCNQHNHGNIVSYRVGLISRIGLAAVESLEGPHDPLRYRAEDFKRIWTEYRERVKA